MPRPAEPLEDQGGSVDVTASLRRRAARCRQLALRPFGADLEGEIARRDGMFDQEAARTEAADKVMGEEN